MDDAINADLTVAGPGASPQQQLPATVTECFSRIRAVLLTARRQALMTVNAAMVQAYWNVGREIVEEEQRGEDRAAYGSRLIEELAANLSKEFGASFTARNLWYMRDFYRAFPILNALRSELSWTHYRLLARVQKPDARNFYAAECAKAHWSTRELERQVNSLLYERLALSRDKDKIVMLAEQGDEPFTPSDLVKDPYVLEFVGLPERGSFHESDLEQALMDRLQIFLLELGRGFFFVARQKRLTIEGDHFYIDLVFYHRTLRCFVLVDLKVGKLTQQDIGQMLLYTGYYEAEEMAEGENPPIGIILCTDKKRGCRALHAVRRNATDIRFPLSALPPYGRRAPFRANARASFSGGGRRLLREQPLYWL
jgi:predicted nuclease of restriction endonuclease-like (RecB) superfamily